MKNNKNTREQVPAEMLQLLNKGHGDRAFFKKLNGQYHMFLVLSDIRKTEMKEFKSDFSLILQDYTIPFLIMKYNKSSFNMPMIGANYFDENYTDIIEKLIIDVIEIKSHGVNCVYKLKYSSVVELNHDMAIAINKSLNMGFKLQILNLPRCVNKIYSNYSPADMLSGGIRQRVIYTNGDAK